MHIPLKLPKDAKFICHLGLKSKVFPGPLTDLSTKIEIMHLKSTVGCQISTLIFGFGGTIHIP
jgi:hypothetical protein